MARMTDAFPTDRFWPLVRRLPAYGRLAWRVGRDPRVPRWRRAVLIGGAAYLASPIDLVPGIIPVAGQLDDAAAVLLGLRFALRGLPPDARLTHLRAAGVAAADLDADLETVRLAAAWIARRGSRLGWRAARGAGRVGARLAERVLFGDAFRRDR